MAPRRTVTVMSQCGSDEHFLPFAALLHSAIVAYLLSVYRL